MVVICITYLVNFQKCRAGKVKKKVFIIILNNIEKCEQEINKNKNIIIINKKKKERIILFSYFLTIRRKKNQK